MCDYLRMHENREEPDELWMHDTVKGCIGRAIAIVNLAGQCGDKDLLPGTLAAACSSAMDELFAAREALDKHWQARKAQEVCHG